MMLTVNETTVFTSDEIDTLISMLPDPEAADAPGVIKTTPEGALTELVFTRIQYDIPSEVVFKDDDGNTVPPVKRAIWVFNGPVAFSGK
jgi:hypothetical protein